MGRCMQLTGGVVVQGDSFGTSLFRQSFQKFFAKTEPSPNGTGGGETRMGFNATTQLRVSKELRVAGCVGNCISQEVKSPAVAETEIGQAGTVQWKACAMTPASTFAYFFDVASQHNQPMPPGGRGYIQIFTQYQHPTAQTRVRVTTLCRQWADVQTQLQYISAGFDQEAAAVVMGRLAVHRAETEDLPDVLRWVDRQLIRLCQKFGTYSKEDADSFALPDNFTLYPQFMFHLRRSQFLQTFGHSPDETVFYRHCLNTEETANCLLMIQPQLHAYTFQGTFSLRERRITPPCIGECIERAYIVHSFPEKSVNFAFDLCCCGSSPIICGENVRSF